MHTDLLLYSVIVRRYINCGIYLAQNEINRMKMNSGENAVQR